MPSGGLRGAAKEAHVLCNFPSKQGTYYYCCVHPTQAEIQGRKVLTSRHRDTVNENGRYYFPQFEALAMDVGIVKLQEILGIQIENEARRSIFQLPGTAS